MTKARVSTTHLLECLRRVLEEHERHLAAVVDGSALSPQVLALAVDEIERLRPLLDQVIRADEGLLVDAAKFADAVQLDGNAADVAALVAAVEIALTEINELPDTDEHFRLVMDAGRVSVTGSTDFAAASSAEQALRGLLVALFAVDLRGNDLAGLVYTEEALDAAHEAILWRLLMRLPDLLHRQPASTLVIIAGDADLQFGLHCVGDPSLRWQVNDDGLQARHPRERDRAAVDDLARIRGTDAALVTLMLGAGASAGYLPLGNDVRDRALGGLMDTPVDRRNYPDVAGNLFRRLQAATDRLLPGEREAGRDEFVRRLTLERVLREERHIERRDLSSTLLWFEEQHDAAMRRLEDDRAAGLLDEDPLGGLLALRRRLVLVTVNFDQVIEAKGGSNVRPFIHATDLAKLPDYLERYAAGEDLPVPLVKAHGHQTSGYPRGGCDEDARRADDAHVDCSPGPARSAAAPGSVAAVVRRLQHARPGP